MIAVGRWALALTALAAAAPSGGRYQAPRSGVTLFKDSRAHLATAIANDRPFVTLVIASRTGQTESIAVFARSMDARVRVQDDEIGYLRIELPPGLVDRLASHPGIDALAVSVPGDNFLPNADVTAAAIEQPAADAGYEWLARHPYRPQADLGVDALRRSHPEFDGRGVTVAVLDGFVDLLLPDFATARDRRGQIVPKVVDQVNATDPRDGDAHWVDMHQTVAVTADRTATIDGASVQLPAAGEWHVGHLREAAFDTNAYLRGDLNRDGNPEGASREFTVAWNRASGRVWIDANQNGDLADDRPVRAYRVAHEVGVLGHDVADTPERESVSFTVTIAEASEAISVNLGFASHGTEIAGALAASRSSDGLVEGIAPAAALINYWHGSSSHGLIEGALRAFRDPRVDLLVVQQNVFLTMDYAADDGGSVVAMMLDRMVTRFGKPAFAPASNIPGPGQLSDVGLGPALFAVGAYETRESWWTFAGARVAHADNISGTGSFGPGGNGRMKPDFAAPTHAVTPHPGFLAGGRNADLYALPPGRAVCGGTSCATPMAAGVAACLIGAARDAGLPLGVDDLRWALSAAARPVRLPAHAVGAGLLQADAAWKLLSSPGRPPRIEVRGEVDTALSTELRDPAATPGTYLRERVSRAFRIRIRRLDGGAGVMRAALSWRQDTPPFRTAATVDLPLGTEVAVDVEVLASSPGLHSAVLAIGAPSSSVPWHLSLHAVAIAAAPGSDPTFTWRGDVELTRPGLATIPVRVPEGASALEVRAEGRVPVRLYVTPPDRKIEPFFAAAQPSTSHIVPRPSPGTWLVSIWNGIVRDRVDASPMSASTHVMLTARIYRVDVAALAADGRVRLENRGAELQAGARSTAMARRTASQWRPGAGGMRMFDIIVPIGADWMVASIAPPKGAGDADLYLFQCDEGACGLLRAAMSRRAGEEVFVPHPRPGRWRLVVDPVSVDRTDPIDVNVDVADPAAGAAVTADVVTRRHAGARWTVRVQPYPRTAPGAERFVARVPVTALGLDAPSWTAPAAPRGGGLSHAPSWFPLNWIEAPAPVRHQN